MTAPQNRTCGERRTMLGSWRIAWRRHCACCSARVWAVQLYRRGEGWIYLARPGRPRPALFATYRDALALFRRRAPATARTMPEPRECCGRCYAAPVAGTAFEGAARVPVRLCSGCALASVLATLRGGAPAGAP